MPRQPVITVRHYCQGIGDSHLIKFRKDNGSDFFMLIDCGLHTSVSGGANTMARVVEDIADATGGRLDVLVVTHEHWDHVSAFLTSADAFKQFKVGEVWMGWTENPDEEAVKELDKFKGLAGEVSKKAALALSPETKGMSETVRNGLVALSGFYFGLKGERVRSARDAAKALAKDGPKYLGPATKPFSLPSVGGVRIYVLGPPRERDLLKLTTRESEMYHFGLSSALGLASGIATAPGPVDPDGRIDMYAPFDIEEGHRLENALQDGEDASDAIVEILTKHYSHPEESWRRIDDDWLYAAADLALQYDSRTNNTSLVLAFEFLETGRVALFAADAQVGNWLSWQGLEWEVDGKTVTGPDLLRRSVYYKVGHHGSENATLSAKGLELMESPDLSAFIPTNAVDALNVGWGRMPFDKILDRLLEKTSGRVIRADDPWVGKAGKKEHRSLASGSIVSLSHKPGLWVEVGIA
jgi:Metallo-beta-lactamase superfamily